LGIAALLMASLLDAGREASEHAPSPLALLERAEQEFAEGMNARAKPEEARRHFRAACDDYEALRQRGANNTCLYRNLGNAALLSDALPTAILAYRRGLRLDPGDRLLQESLAYARDQVAYPPETPKRPATDPWSSWCPCWLGSNWLSWSALGLYTGGCFAGTGWLIARRRWLLVLSITGLALSAILGFCWWTVHVQAMEDLAHPVVVIAADTIPLRTGNGSSYPPHRALPAVRQGMEGRLQFVRGDWLQVEFPGGQVGWLPRASVLVEEHFGF
jgi:hypothetical protein